VALIPILPRKSQPRHNIILFSWTGERKVSHLRSLDLATFISKSVKSWLERQNTAKRTHMAMCGKVPIELLVHVELGLSLFNTGLKAELVKNANGNVALVDEMYHEIKHHIADAKKGLVRAVDCVRCKNGLHSR
jgi:hypothetical protein